MPELNIKLKKKKMKRSSIYIPDNLMYQVEDIAAKNDISVNSTIVQLIELALDVGEAYQQGIVQVVDHGDLDGLAVDHDRIEPGVGNL
tara:strand:- start:190 stop:453 length:264 start_codon:yes stop_codon:yes gene_type:complete